MPHLFFFLLALSLENPLPGPRKAGLEYPLYCFELARRLLGVLLLDSLEKYSSKAAYLAPCIRVTGLMRL